MFSLRFAITSFSLWGLVVWGNITHDLLGVNAINNFYSENFLPE